MEGYAAVLSRDGQGGVLLREADKLEKFEDKLLGCPTNECSFGSCCKHAHPRRGGNAGKENSQLESRRRAPSLARSHAMVQTRISGATGGINGEARIAKTYKNVNELQVADMQWELTLVEHESKFPEVVADSVGTAAMRAMLPKDVVERFLEGPFHYEELRNRVSANVGETLAGQDANGGSQPMDIGKIDKSEGEDEDVHAVRQRRSHDRSNQKHKQESDNERKTLQPSGCQFITISITPIEST